ncbi:hypothetical protein F4561_001704 [Lipingzhangella halophila]|uniref:Uncharacterized protein n=1 Tax=Lipingzhangella halophila TaxID=1783352 RepID=A0A7W7W2K6_9ACTN|nr:hypothetical protein [Lipingzhangella halophila]MBB4930884.1 hypothetical protein [Lipingzhangella halophila]
MATQYELEPDISLDVDVETFATPGGGEISQSANFAQARGPVTFGTTCWGTTCPSANTISC